MTTVCISRNDITRPGFKEVLANLDGKTAQVVLNGVSYEGQLSVSDTQLSIPTLLLTSPEVTVELFSDSYNNGYLHTFDHLSVRL